MSIQLYIGHSGQRLRLDPAITTIDALRSWIEHHTAVAPKAQILLTAQGKQVRPQTLLTENELFVFDSKLFASRDPTALPEPDNAEADSFDPGAAPDTISNQNDLQAWQNLFRLRKIWASSALTACAKLAEQAEVALDEEYVIGRSLAVAVASLQQHVKNGEKKYATVNTWADEVLREQDTQLRGWDRNLDGLRSIPARSEFARFLYLSTSGSKRLSQQSNTTSLQAFVDVAQVNKAAAAAKRVTDGLSDRLTNLHGKLTAAAKDSDELLHAVDQFNNNSRSDADSQSEPTQLRKEIELIVGKMSSDLDHVQSLPRNSQSVSQASKMALLHTRNYLPNLAEYCVEMNELFQRTRHRRAHAAESALDYMRSLSAIESQLADLYTDANSFGLAEDDQSDFTTLSTVTRLPSVYGQLLVESVRRREWVAKMKRDSAVLQEEMATYQEEEEKRRRKWMRSVEDVVSAEAVQSSRALGIELSMQNEGGSWPMVTRQELQDYQQVLVHIYGQGPLMEEMDQAIRDLDKPTRKQIKRAKAFKNGSMHEAAFGDTSLMLRGDEQYKALRDSNVRLDEELKAQKSRVRKLEDLYHRATQASRPSAGDIFAPHAINDRMITPPVAPSPQRSGELSSSLSNRHRRLSSNLGIEEKKLARRVVDLEAELQAVREEACSRKGSDADAQRQVEEAISTKRDLMENMEARQREFASERRNLELELREAKDRLEEVETEIERLMGSRDDERTGIGARVAGMEGEMARLKEDAAGHSARAAMAQDARAAMERKLDISENARAFAEEELQRMKAEMESMRQADAEHVERLALAHAHLSPQASTPTGVFGLATALEELARRSTAHAKDLAEAVAFAKSENESLRSTSDTHQTELATVRTKQTETDDQLRQMRERLAAEEAKVASLQQQLEGEQEQLKVLRTKFADGETGSEVLRHRAAEEEARAGKLSSQLAEAKSHVSSLDAEIARLQKRDSELRMTSQASAERLDKRATHAKNISQRLYAQNARLSRLLERLGLALSYQDDVMVVERASKLGASTTMNDLHRTVSLTSPPPGRKFSAGEDPADLSILRWSDAQSAQDEDAQVETFLQHISRFNIDTFSEAVVKRLRDFEYTAKKYNKEAKEATKRADAYKDRSLRLKGEAHAKVAVKDFKDGDLALFLPTRGQAKGAWAAFNLGCPHYFLAEKEGMRLGSRDFIVARIAKVEQKVVDLSKSSTPRGPDADATAAACLDDDNPFDLSDGLTWWMVHATEERGTGAAAPTTPGLGKSTVAAANVDARGSIRVKRGGSKGDDASKHLNKSLDSRRSSSTSKKSVPGAVANAPNPAAAVIGSPATQASPDFPPGRLRSESQTSLRPPPGPSSGLAPAPASDPIGLGVRPSTDDPDGAQPSPDQVRRDLLFGP